MGKSKEDFAYTKGLLFGTLLGGAVGAITALLLAPKSGAELRRDLAEKSQDVYDKASDYMANIEGSVGSVVNTTVNESKIRAQSIIDSAKDQAQVLIENAESVLSDAKEKALSASKDVSDKISQVKEAAKAGSDAFKQEMKSASNDVDEIIQKHIIENKPVERLMIKDKRFNGDE